MPGTRLLWRPDVRTSLREGSGMVSRGSVGLLPALKGRQKKRAGWDTIVWLDLRIVVPEVGEGKGQVKETSLSLNNHAGGTPWGYQQSVRC